MKRKGNEDPVILCRREAVGHLAARGMTSRAITAALGEMDPPILNPGTGKPFTKSMIGYDIVAIKKQWREDAKQAIGEHVAEQLAIIREVQRKAWAKDDLELVLKCMDRIGKLLGLNAPERSTIDLYPPHDMLALSDEALLALVMRNGGSVPQGVLAALDIEDPDPGTGTHRH